MAKRYTSEGQRVDEYNANRGADRKAGSTGEAMPQGPRVPPVSSQGGQGAAFRRREMKKLGKEEAEKSPIPLEFEVEVQVGPGTEMLNEANRAELSVGLEHRKAISSMWKRRFALNSRMHREVVGEMFHSDVGDAPVKGFDGKTRPVVGRLDKMLERSLGSATRLVPETIEKDSERIFSNPGDLTNEQVALDNYEFVLSNISSIKVNIAKVLLAKMDADRNLPGVVKDFLDDKKLGLISQDPDAVVKEMFNRIRSAGLRHEDEYAFLLKMYRKAVELERKEGFYEETLTEEFSEKFSEATKEARMKLLGADEEAVERGVKLEEISKMVMHVLGEETSYPPPEDDETFGMYIQRMIQANADRNDDLQANGLPPQPVDPVLINLFNAMEKYDLGIAKLRGEDVKQRALDYFSINENYPRVHNLMMDSAGDAYASLLEYTDEYPRGMLYAIAGGAVSDNLFEEGELEEFMGSVKAAISDGFSVGEEKADKITQSFVRILRSNKEAISSAIEVSDADRRNPYAFGPGDTKKHDLSAIAIRNALFLAGMKNAGNLGEKYYDTILHPVEEKFLKVDRIDALSELKPNVDEVVDFFNSYMVLSKTVSSEMSPREAEKILNSKVFEENDLLGPKKRGNKDRDALLSLTKEMGDIAKKKNSKDLYGSPSREEYRNALLSMAYLDYAKKVGQNKSDIGSPLSMVGGMFFNNNRALENFVRCAEKAKVPTNNVETVGSLSKGCLEKLGDELRKDAEAGLDNLVRMGKFAAFNPFMGLMILQQVKARALSDLVEAESIILQRKINESISMIEQATDQEQEIARHTVLSANENATSGKFVRVGFEEEYDHSVERVGVEYDIIKNTEGDEDERYGFTLLSVDSEEFQGQEEEIAAYIDRLASQIRQANDEISGLASKRPAAPGEGGETAEQISEKISSLKLRIGTLNSYYSQALQKKESLEVFKNILGKKTEGGESHPSAKLFTKKGVSLSELSMESGGLFYSIKAGHYYLQKLYERKASNEIKGKAKENKRVDKEIEMMEKFIAEAHRKMIVSDSIIGEVVTKIIREHTNSESLSPKELEALSQKISIEIQQALKDTKGGEERKKRRGATHAVASKYLSGVSEEAKLRAMTKIDGLLLLQDKIGGGGTLSVDDMEGIDFLLEEIEKNEKTDFIYELLRETNRYYNREVNRFGDMVFMETGVGYEGYLHQYENELKNSQNPQSISKGMRVGEILKHKGVPADILGNMAAQSKTVEEANARMLKEEINKLSRDFGWDSRFSEEYARRKASRDIRRRKENSSSGGSAPKMRR